MKEQPTTIQDLDDGEEICSVCDGTGKEAEIQGFCCKCNGKGKVDWITNVMGVKNFDFVIDDLDPIDFPEDIVNALGKKIADDIDKEIMGSLISKLEQN